MAQKLTFVSLIAVAALLGSFEAPAKTYTPAQLRKSVDSGKPPKQGSPATQSQPEPFSSCVPKVKGVVASVGGNYPAKVIVNTTILYMVKVWTNDAAMTLSCSAPDGKLVITTAKYL